MFFETKHRRRDHKKCKKNICNIQKSMTPIGQESVESEVFKNYCFINVKLSFLRWPEVACLSKGGHCSPPREPFAPSWAQNLRRRGAKKDIRRPPKAHMGPLQKKCPPWGPLLGVPKSLWRALERFWQCRKRLKNSRLLCCFEPLGRPSETN